ncbi:MAG: aspartate kinase, partial [Arcobacteraceae bacterium]
MLKVLKFGGTSVGTLDRISNVASIVKGMVDKGDKIVVVVSAMSGETNKLIEFA